MKKTKKYLIGFVAVISVLIVIPFFIPMRSYLDQAQLAASEKIGVPVTIASGSLFLLPTPRVIARDITIGKQQELTLAEVSIIPDLKSLLSETRVLELKVDKPIIKKAAMEILSAYTSKQSKADSGPAAVNVKRVLIDELQLDWPGMQLPVMRMDVHLTDANALQSASLETADGALKADIKPEAGGHVIKLDARKWTLPVGLPLLVNKAVLEMHLKGDRLDIPSIDIALYDGNLNGNALLSWEKGWRTSGKLNVKNLSVKEPSSMLSKSVYLSGKLNGNGAFSGNAKQASALADNLNADFRFDVTNGVLHGLDLVKIASLLTKQGGGGGETEFDEFSGVLNIKGKQYGLRDINISSGLLAANGQVKIKPDKALDGVVEVELKKGVSLAAIPLQVSGTLDKPAVFPTKAALAGAVAGTALLGPGVGTSLGIKAGGAVDKLKGLFQSK
jgi:uncharacterized protein involved in outer membrane biogenesis